MSLRRLLFKHVDSKSVLYKLIAGRRQSTAQCVSRVCAASGQSANRLQVFGKKLFPVYSSLPSWKWLLAIPLVYAGYDNQSEL